MLRTLALALTLAFTAIPASAQNTERAVFAGGCFWCVESDFDKVGGVISTTSGYIGGQNANPTYENHPGHREAVEIVYDPGRVSYEALLSAFFRSVDPTDGGGQFCDRGHEYSTAVYAVGNAQLAAARNAKSEAAQALGGVQLATEIVPAPQFWPAEEYHQDYYTKNPLRYRYYRSACGRDNRVREVWGSEAMAGIKGS
ncbi:peptide-methionine (S)-S-oxide reductase MsrA [Aliihoeflea sp. 40Bstr573]|uniref:peptide-methionine (S)-S-oxide reductase MsrA n=1 Tax=Aliihoeflea sp. 40Bstr573 TaxID=2696467 RepID=UPI002095362B|nr:peptide-methionine (S)-S-oxide reductase MsrA [Aliihoeflea sp. 40Bstr573]MCO6388123.1 peptide-methionine (S)-S-oxide reductase MsrA [Aliihoeflea sp. 40Bstr573]